MTTLPDGDLTFKDLWTVSGHAFAIAESPTLGIRVLEWKDSDETWTYIDDNTQNEWGAGQYAGRIWAPGKDELYYTVAPRRIYHGKRSDDGAWSWTYAQLDDPTTPVPGAGPASVRGAPKTYAEGVNFSTVNLAYVPLGVFGTGPDDVYAWYENIIYHATFGQSRNPTWSIEYIADDIDNHEVVDFSGNYEQLFFLDAAGVSKDDLWFTGGRGLAPNHAWPGGSCAMAVRKTPAGYRRVIDGYTQQYSTPVECAPRNDRAFVGSTAGWLTNVHALTSNLLVGLRAGKEIARIAVDGEDVAVALTPIPMEVSKMEVFSLWTSVGEPMWIGGFNRVVRADVDAGDGGVWALSTISLNGGRLETPIYQMRGSANADLWAVGARYALRKKNH